MVKIKKTTLLGVCLAFVLLLAMNAFAAVTITQGNTVTFEADYSGFDVEDQVVIPESGSFTISNTDPTNRTVVVTIEGLPSSYNYTTIANQDIASGATATINFNLNVPHEKDQGTEVIGAIVVSDLTGTELTRADLVQNTLTMLNFEDIEVEYFDEDGRRQRDSFNADGSEDSFDLDENVRVGTEMTITFEMRNLFPDQDYDESEIQDVELQIEVDDNDFFPDDFEENYDIGDINADDKEIFEVTFQIPEEAPANDYTLTFTLTGEDRQNVRYEVVKEISLDLERLDDDVRILETKFTPATIDSCDASVLFEVAIKNYGTDNQRDVTVEVKNSELGINEIVENIELDEFDEGDDEWSNLFQLEFPDNFAAKRYNFDVNLLIDNRGTQEFRRVSLDVEDCETGNIQQETENNNQNTETFETTQTTTGTNQNNQQNTETTESTAEVITGSTIVRTQEAPYTSIDLVVGVFVLAIVLMLSIIVLLVYFLTRTKKE